MSYASLASFSGNVDQVMRTPLWGQV
jgi:hypothetical protein